MNDLLAGGGLTSILVLLGGVLGWWFFGLRRPEVEPPRIEDSRPAPVNEEADEVVSGHDMAQAALQAAREASVDARVRAALKVLDDSL